MSKYIPFDEIKIGEVLGPWEIQISPQTIEQYCKEYDDYNPMYMDNSPFGYPVVPPAFLATYWDLRLLHTKYDAHATVPYKTEQEFINPAKVGKRLIANGKIVDKYVRHGLEYLVIESTLTDEDGVLIRKMTDHFSLGLE